MRHTTKDDKQKLNNMKPQHNMDYQSPFAVPPGLEDDTKHYRWVNYEIRGKPTRHIDDADRRGYDMIRPVKDMVRRGSRDLMKRNDRAAECIFNVDTALMSCDKEIAGRFIQKHDDNSQRVVKSLTGVKNIHNNSGRINSF